MDKVAIGVFYTAAEPDTGQAGVAFTPVPEIPGAVCCPRSASRMPAAGRLAGQSAWELLGYALDDTPLKVSLGIATLNALSALVVEEQGLADYWLLKGADALDVVQVGFRAAKRSEIWHCVAANWPFCPTSPEVPSTSVPRIQLLTD